MQTEYMSSIRKGPAGKGNFYERVHGDIKYNRRKSKKDGEREVGVWQEDVEKDKRDVQLPLERRVK